jgi:hypothetical protein
MRIPVSSRARSLFLLVSVLSSPALCQGILPDRGPAVTRAPAPVLQAFAVRAGLLEELAVPVPAGPEITVTVQIGEAPHTLRLLPQDVRTPDFQLLVHDAQGLHNVPVPPSVTWRGTVDGIADSAVAASLANGQFDAVVRIGSQLFGVEPVSRRIPAFPPTLYVVYDSRDAIGDDLVCGVQHGLVAKPKPSAPGVLAVMKVADIACDADMEFYQRNGSNVTNTQNQITSILNGVDVIYRRDVEIQYRITTIIVRTTAIYVQTSMQSALPEFANYWNATQGGVVRDVAHLFTGKGTFSGVIGIAYLGVVCNLANAYGMTRAYSSSLTTNVGLVSHELGHNWNAPHCDGAVPCNIMCSGLGGCSGNISAFDPVSVNAIVAFKNSCTCLANPAPPPTMTALSRSAVQTYAPQTVTVTGTNLTGVTRVTVGGVNAPSFTINSATSLTFTPPNLLNIQFHQVVAHTDVNSSNPLVLLVTGNHPSVIEAPQLIVRNQAMPYRIHTDAAHVGLFYMSTSNVPSSAPGVVDFGIGNGFAALFHIATFAANSAGQVQFTLTVPSSIPASTVLYWQAITLNVSNFSLPLETSNVATSTVFL